MATQVTRPADLRPNAMNQRAEDIALALMGVGALAPEQLAETASWDQTQQGTLVGRRAILEKIAQSAAPEQITISEIVTQGKAGTVSGTLRRAGRANTLFCHVLRFTASNGAQLAQMVSFEHEDAHGGRG